MGTDNSTDTGSILGGLGQQVAPPAPPTPPPAPDIDLSDLGNIQVAPPTGVSGSSAQQQKPNAQSKASKAQQKAPPGNTGGASGSWAAPGPDEKTIGPARTYDPTELRQLAPGEKPRAGYSPVGMGTVREDLNKFTEGIESYDQAGRAEHPILSKLGDITKSVKELLQGGQSVGKPYGTTSGLETNPVVQALAIAPEAAAGAATAEQEAAKFIGRVRNVGEVPNVWSKAAAPLTTQTAPTAPPAVEAPPMPTGEPVPSADLDDQIIGGIPITPPTHTVVETKVPPHQFLNTVGANDGGALSDETIQSYRQQIRDNPESVQPPTLEYDEFGNIAGGDGRHRAMAHALEGTERMPVRILRRIPQEQPVEEPRIEISEPEQTAKTGKTELSGPIAEYVKSKGLPEINPEAVEPDSRQSEIADAYKAATHQPDNPQVKASYDALKRDVKDQFNFFRTRGIRMDTAPENPYGLNEAVPAHEELHNDVLHNKHLTVWEGGAPPADHPLSEVDPETGFTYNEMFRMVHDIAGHAAELNDFSPAGEESAWNLHRQMFSPEARPALATETRGQAAYTYKYGDFPPQKATILPSEYQVRPEDLEGGVQTRAAKTAKSANGDNAESQQATTSATPVTPLQKIADKYGVSDDPSKIKDGASFITPEGQFIHLTPGVPHEMAIDEATGKSGLLSGKDTRPDFLKDSGAIRVRFSNDRGGPTAHISVPAQGVTEEQIPAIQQSIAQAGRYGNVVLERSDITPETKDRLSMTQEFPRPSDTEDYLRRIEAHPDQHAEGDGEGVSATAHMTEDEEAEINEDLEKHAKRIQEMEDSDTRRTTGTNLLERLPESEGYSGTARDDIHHEFGHSVVATAEGASIDGGVYSDRHPENFEGGGVASVNIDWRAFGAKSEHDVLTYGDAAPHVDKVLSILMGGPAADDVMTGVHLKDNPGAKGDLYMARDLLDALEYTPEQASDLIDAAYERAKGHLTTPGVTDIMKQYSAEREEGLTENLHTSPEKLQEMMAKVKELYENQGNNPTVNEGAGEVRPNVDTGAEGEGASGVEQQVAKKGIKKTPPPAEPEQNDAVGFIDPTGKFQKFNQLKGKDIADEATHVDFAANRDTDIPTLLKEGWVRKAGQGSYDVGQLNPQTTSAIEKDILQDYHELKEGTADYGLPVKSIVIDTQNGTIEIPTDDFVEKYNGDLNKAIKAVGKPEPETEPTEWHEKAAALAAKQSAGGINPADGTSDTKGFGSEFYPEARQALDHVPTAEDFKQYAEDHEDLLAQNPELRVGWDNNSKVPGGHEINIGAVGEKANVLRLARKLEQRAGYDIAKNADVPLGKNEGLRTEFPNYPIEDRLKDLRGEAYSDRKNFEYLTDDVYDHLAPDEKKYLDGNKALQTSLMNGFHKIVPSVNETTNAMQAGAALGGWWKRYIDVFHALAPEDSEAVANIIGPSHAEVLKQWHAAVSGNKSVELANNLAWGSYADWLEAGKPTDRQTINALVIKHRGMSDSLTRSGKMKTPGIDTGKLFRLVNSPEMKGERPFHGDVYNDEQANPLLGKTEGARKIPSMGATVAGPEGNLNRLVIDTHILDFYGQNHSSVANYLADSAHLRMSAEDLGLKPGEGQEQLWGTVLGLKKILKEGLTSEEAAAKLDAGVINDIGKDYAEIIQNDPEITGKGGILDQLAEKYGIGGGSATASEKIGEILSARQASQGGLAGSKAPVDTAELAKTAERIKGTISEKKIKTKAIDLQQQLFGEYGQDVKSGKASKDAVNVLDFLNAFKKNK